MSDHQKVEFESALRRIKRSAVDFSFSGRTLASLGESFYCYVPRLLRELEFGHVADLSYIEITSYYAAGSWAIDDLILLLERIADKAGIFDTQIAVATASASPTVDSDASGTSIHFVPAFQDSEPDQIGPLSSVSTGNIQARSEVVAKDSAPERVAMTT